jgi:hypothetical protein
LTFNAELAAAARWISAAVERLPENARPDVAEAWGRLADRLDNCRSDGSRELCLIAWRAEMEERLSTRLLHALYLPTRTETNEPNRTHPCPSCRGGG